MKEQATHILHVSHNVSTPLGDQREVVIQSKLTSGESPAFSENAPCLSSLACLLRLRPGQLKLFSISAGSQPSLLLILLPRGTQNVLLSHSFCWLFPPSHPALHSNRKIGLSWEALNQSIPHYAICAWASCTWIVGVDSSKR